MRLRGKFFLCTMAAGIAFILCSDIPTVQCTTVEAETKELTESEAVSDTVESSQTVSKSEPEELGGEDVEKPVEAPKAVKKKKKRKPTPTVTETPIPTDTPAPTPGSGVEPTIVEEPVVDNPVEEEPVVEEVYDEVQSEPEVEEVSSEPTLTYYGACTITCYWASEGPENSTTASGAVPTQGITVGNGNMGDHLPWGTVVYIEGFGQFVVQDCGDVDAYWFDLYANTEADAWAMNPAGMITANVYIVG